jgi:hypothetical protein
VSGKKDRRKRRIPRSRQPEAEPGGAGGTAQSRMKRVLDRAAQPGRPVTYLLVVAIVVIGWRWPRYVVDPTSTGGTAHRVVALAIAATLFLSFSTLTILAYCLAVGGSDEVVKAFIAAVLNRAGIGATLGTLLGIRLAPALLDPSSTGYTTFPNYLGDVGNSITLVTLLLTSTVWPYAVGPLRVVVGESLRRLPFHLPEAAARVIVFAILLGVNGIGVALATAVYADLTKH